MPILVVGTVAFDTVETPFGRAERILGGSATYAALAARLLAGPVHVNAVVGGDFPEAHLDTLRDRGVDTDGIVRDADGETFFWAGRYYDDLNSRDTLATHLNVLATFTPDLPAHYRRPRVAVPRQPRPDRPVRRHRPGVRARRAGPRHRGHDELLDRERPPGAPRRRSPAWTC